MMEYNLKYGNNTQSQLRKTAALVDGLITLAGFTIAFGGFFHSEVAMWWLGA